MDPFDHRKLGKELGFFAFSNEVGQGLPLWLPKGQILRDELEYLANQTEREAGYKKVSTPHLAKEGLYHKSGHLPYYSEDMYAPIEIEKVNYYLRPMNCPHHHEVFLSEAHTHTEMPIRIAEYGQVYRYENSGNLSGLMRVRGFCQNDAHIYSGEEHLEAELLNVLKMHQNYYNLFDVKEYKVLLSLPDFKKTEKFGDFENKDEWEKCAKVLESALQKSGMPSEISSGDAAFYGPKIDFAIKASNGSEYTISTCQLDFQSGKKFELNYKKENGEDAPVYVIHRAPLGSHERFVAFLIEHYKGAFPTWISPVQANVLSVAYKDNIASDDINSYTQKITNMLNSKRTVSSSGYLRVEQNLSDEGIGKKIKKSYQNKAPYSIIVGQEELNTNTVSIRLRDGKQKSGIGIQDCAEILVLEANTRQSFITNHLDLLDNNNFIQEIIKTNNLKYGF